MDYLQDQDKTAYNCVNEIVVDEREHHDRAEEQVDPNSVISRLLIGIVKSCTEAVIKFGMR